MEDRAGCSLGRFAWLGNFRRRVVRYDHPVENYSGFVHLVCILILLRQDL